MQKVNNRTIQTETNPHEMTNRKQTTENEKDKHLPLSGSKKVKNRNHSRNNHGEGR